MMEQTDTPYGCGIPINYDPDNCVPFNDDCDLQISAFTIHCIDKLAYILNGNVVMSDSNSWALLGRSGVIHKLIIVLKRDYCPDDYFNCLPINTMFQSNEGNL